MGLAKGKKNIGIIIPSFKSLVSNLVTLIIVEIVESYGKYIVCHLVRLTIRAED